MNRFEVAVRLREVGSLLRLKKGVSFKARAFEQAASSVEAISDQELAAMLQEKRLQELPGVGQTIAKQIGSFAEVGTSRFLEELRSEFPRAIFELSSVTGVSLVRAIAIHQALGIETVEALEEACRRERIRALPGFGPKTEAKILEAIESAAYRSGRMRIHEARRQAETIVQQLKTSRHVIDAHITGPVRRFVETVASIDVLCVTRDPRQALAAFRDLPFLVRTTEVDPQRGEGFLSNGVAVSVLTCAPENLGGALVASTGSKAHLAALELRARERNISLDNESFVDEASVYEAVGLPLMPPEIREDAGQIHDLETGHIRLPLLSVADLKGVVHCHTLFSDGTETVLDMAREAQRRGYEYITITDHSESAFYAGGVKAETLPQQWEKIAEAQAELGIRVMRGTESDILIDGRIDYADDILSELEVVIASVHSRFKMDSPQMTKRILQAMHHRFFKIWGHPLGRLLLRRDPIACDVETILNEMATSRAAIEINGEAYRLDMPPEWIRVTRKLNIPFVVSTDAHGKRSMNNVELAVAMARRGGVAANEVLNTQNAESFAASVKPAS